MADITYIVNQDDPNNVPGFENFSQADLNLIQQFQINSLFDVNKHFVELYITDLAGNIIESDSNYSRYKLLGTAQSAGREGASILTIDPIEDSKAYGYENGGIKLLYHFINDLYTQDKTTTQFYISAISPDRTEVQLQNLNLTNEQILSFTSTIKDRLATQAYFSEFRLNFGENDLLIGINIDNLAVGTNQTVVVKLYEPLPATYSEKSTLSIVETISDSVAFEVDTIFQPVEEIPNTLRPANFNLDLTDNQVIPTQYLGYNDLFSYPVNNTNNQLYSLVSEKGAELSIDHSNYSDFVHFSSAYERLVNFKYKLQLIESYTINLGLIQAATSQSLGVTGSINYYENLITGVVNNFDHYERYLYYQSSSYAWPKSNSTQPYINYPSTSSEAVTWYANQLTLANKYDLTNGSILINSIPTYLRDDPNNENYLTFIHMIGQHFDNLWIYAKAVSDKYDGDNRLDHGISKDLVGEALKNFGVKLYTSNKSIEDLFGSFIGQGYQSGSEYVSTYITGSVTGSGLPVEDIGFDNYTKEVQKRIYHNLPFILKTKGTERGVRALINCFGIPSDILKIKIYGGRNTQERPFYGDFRYFTGSLDKIRLDNTGSLISGSTLSQYTSIYKRDKKYTDDLHKVEIGFSPVDNIDNLIVSYSLATGSLSTFNIDNYIGDPRSLYSSEYGLLNVSGSISTSLDQIINQIMSGSSAYNVQDYIRLIKFFDNVVFKMVRDYVPGRSTVDTGIIIKPHLLQRNKAKSPILTGSRPEYTGSIDTGFISGSNAGSFGSRDQYTTITRQNPTVPSSNFRLIQTPIGLGEDYRHGHEETKFDGDFSGSNIVVTNGNLTSANTYTQQIFSSLIYNINLVSGSTTVCLLVTQDEPIWIIPEVEEYQFSKFFAGPQTQVSYTASVVGGPLIPITFPYTFTDDNFEQYDEITLTATSSIVPNCQVEVQALYASCSVALTGQAPNQLAPNSQYDLTQWFTPPPNISVKYYENGTEISNPTSYITPATPSTVVQIQVKDTIIEGSGFSCNAEVTRTLNQGCLLDATPSTYTYDDSAFGKTITTEGINNYTIRKGDGNFTISSLFSGTTSQTEYSVKVVYYPYPEDPESVDFWINPGIGPDPNALDVNNPWTGDEQFTLIESNAANGIWGWNIVNGIFSSGTDTYGTYQEVESVINIGTINYIEIRAYDNTIGTLCEWVVRIYPPVNDTLPTCGEGEYTCEYDEGANQFFAVPTQNCIAPPSTVCP